MRLSRLLLLSLLLLLAGYIAGRTRSLSQPPSLQSSDESDLKAIGLLGRRDEVHFKKVRLEEALAMLSRIYGVAIKADTLELERSGIDSGIPVDYDGQNVELRDVLLHLSYPDKTSTPPLGYRLNGTLIILTTAEAAARDVVTRVYDVERLLYLQLHSTRKQLIPLTEETPPVVDAPPPTPPFAPITPAEKLEQQINELAAHIRDTIDAGSWIENGGQMGSLRVISGHLVVVQTRDVQMQIVDLLNRLEAATIARVQKRQELIDALQKANAATER